MKVHGVVTFGFWKRVSPKLFLIKYHVIHMKLIYSIASKISSI